ncbi:MAG: radical SAM protein [Sulfolobales archaeon]
MTDHHGKEFIGFMATSPAVFLPEFLWMYICCPKPEVDEFGRPKIAPYGLRKVEARLIDSGYRAAIIDPDYIDRYIDKIRILMIGHHDYFAYGPPSSEWWLITGRAPVNRKNFIKFITRESIKRAKKKGLKIVVGGPAAWQWLWEPELWSEMGVDLVIEGEVERVLPSLVDKLMNGETVPRYYYVGSTETPSVDEIPEIKAPSVNGLVEIMRGCPRGCSFCSVTLRSLRYYPLEKIEKEILVNVRNGVTSGILHSDDVLLYGAKGVIPSPEPLIKLHELALRHYRSIAWSHASLAAIVVAQREYKLISRLTDMIYSKTEQNYLGVEVGIETGSVRLAKIIMPAKAAPYRPEQYPEIVEEAFSIMHDHNIIPAATFILGLPGETPEDVEATIELIRRLRPYRSLIVPMIFVPMGVLRRDKESGIQGITLTKTHIEALWVSLEHSIYWAEDILSRFYVRERSLFLLRGLLRFFLNAARRKAYSLRKSLDKYENVTLSIYRGKKRV